jgi:hypothetical protein
VCFSPDWLRRNPVMTRCTIPSTGVSNSGWAASRIRAEAALFLLPQGGILRLAEHGCLFEARGIQCRLAAKVV